MRLEEKSAVIRARYWHIEQDGRLKCDLCPRGCRLQEGQRGFCFIREHRGSEMVLTTYGRSSGFCIDPIEKKPLNHFLPGSAVLSFGTAGCNLGCKFCQNWDISKSREMDSLCGTALPQTLAVAAKEAGCASVAFTYNDPVIFLEYAVDTAAACHEQGIKTAAVTAGYICPEPRIEFFKHMNAANVDLKSFSDGFYRRMCGARLEPILETLVYLRRETAVWLELTTLLIPGENDSPRELDQMTQWIARELGPEVPLHFTAFHPDYRLREKSPTSLQSLRNAREIAHKNGMQYVYTGNARDIEGATTHCPSCGEAMIVRDGYEISTYRLASDGCCGHCGERIAGVFADRPGTWGGRRQALLL